MRVAAFAFGALILLAAPARAEETAPPPPEGATRRDVGTGLVAGGALVGSLGAGLYFLTRPGDDPACKCASSSWIFPTVLMGLGGAMFATGVPLWITGQRSIDSAKLHAELRIGPLGGSVRVLF